MRRLVSLFLLVLGALLGTPQAWALELYVWRPLARPTLAVVFATPSEQSPESSFKTYLKNFRRSPELSELLLRSPAAESTEGTFEKLNDRDFNERVLILANMPGDIHPEGSRVTTFTAPMLQNQVNSYILPIAADLGIEDQSQELIDLLNEKFSAFLPIGGDDTDRTLFNESNHLSHNTNLRRDRFEAALISRKLKTIQEDTNQLLRKDRILGVCRGAQLVASLMGHRLGLDLPTDNPLSPIRHGTPKGNGPAYVENSAEPTHNIELVPGTQSLLRSLLPEVSTFVGNTYHHQHIIPAQNARIPLTVTAISPEDGVVEAAEYKNSILLFQFHPELMLKRSRGEVQLTGEKIMNGVAMFLTPHHRMACQRLLKKQPI